MVTRIRTTWQIPPSQAAADLEASIDRLISDIARALMSPGQDMLQFAKSNHPWVNRTGEAEAGLNVSVEVQGDTIWLHLDHRAPHGKWLEHRWGGKWGVIPESLRYGSPRVAAIVTSLLRR